MNGVRPGFSNGRQRERKDVNKTLAMMDEGWKIKTKAGE